MAEYDLRAHEHYTTIVCKRMNAATQTMEPVLDHLIIMPMAMEILLLQPTEGSRLMRLDLIDISLQWNDPEAVKKSSLCVYIPMEGIKELLNVASAFAIASYLIRYQGITNE